MNVLERALYKTRKSFRQVCDEIGIPWDGAPSIDNLDECSSCNIWLKHRELRPDLDGHPICEHCYTFYGL